MSNLRKFNRQRREKNKRFILFIFLMTMALFACFYFSIQKIKSSSEIVDKKILEQQQEAQALKVQIEALKEDYKNRNTDSFKEKIAREKLGMEKVSSDENSN
ncbi:MAG: septum formation initiator family protein [Peptoniphilaceae bacterium]|nr:septum formation initiator family protein [Peptoniphilaceae bacterium]MDD7383347.1 septum formation initiator family protein [Peptoniphilaceae bacterium]MDY3738282.1 septum formation initiator family protein [Peptoniphilaceae bacterium]